MPRRNLRPPWEVEDRIETSTHIWCEPLDQWIAKAKFHISELSLVPFPAARPHCGGTSPLSFNDARTYREREKRQS